MQEGEKSYRRIFRPERKSYACLMKNAFALVLAIGICCPALFAQKQKGKPKLNLDYLTATAWKFDSVAMTDFPQNDGDDGPRITDSGPEKDIRIKFLSNGKVILSHPDGIGVSEYEMLTGSENQYIAIRAQGVAMLITIDSLSPTRFVCEGQLMAKMSMFLSPAFIDHSASTKQLAGEYIASNPRNPYNYEDEYELRSLFTLREDGTMKHYLMETPDSGTWRLDTLDYSLLLIGKKTLRVTLNESQGNRMSVHLPGTPEDSSTHLRISPLEREKTVEEMVDRRVMDSIMTADSIAYEQEMMEAEMYEETMTPASVFAYEKEILTTEWTAEFQYTDYPNGDSMRVPVKLKLRNDGNFLLTKGKKTYKGTWRHGSESQYLILTYKGKEQVVVYSIIDNYYESDMPRKKCMMSLVLPGEKRSGSFLFVAKE